MEAAATRLKEKTSSLQMFASFCLAESELAISISSLQEVVNFPEKVAMVPMAPEYLTGLFNLRGVVTPIVDMGRLLGVESKVPSDQRKVAIVCVDRVRIGLLFDATSEILNLQEQDISWFEEETLCDKKSVIRGVLKIDNGDRIVEIIDPLSLIKIENIPHILGQTKSNVVEVSRKNSKRCQCITFRCGSLEFGLQISAISEIIRVPEIKKSVLAVSYCIGLVNLRGMVIPILDFQKFLKIEGETNDDIESKRIIILKIDGFHIGFLVDNVDSIVTFFENDLLPIPMFKQEKIDMMKGLLCHQSGLNVILLNELHILSNQEILEITKGHDTLYGKKGEQSENLQKKTSERKPYLSFRLEYLLSTRLSAIDEIAKMSDDVICPPGYPEYVVGMLNMRGDVIMIVDLRAFYGMKAMEDRTNSRILIVKGRKSKFGLLVDEVESINTLDESQKIHMPSVLAQDAVTALHGDVRDVVEMPDMGGNKKTFMIFEVSDFISKIEVTEA